MPLVERYRRMADEMRELSRTTQDADLAEVFHKLADQYAKLAEAEQKLSRTDNT